MSRLMTTPPKPGRPKSPCKHCGGMDRYQNGQCKPCYRKYMRKYRKQVRL